MPVIFHVVGRSGQRTIFSSLQAPLKYAPILFCFLTFSFFVFGSLASFFGTFAVVCLVSFALIRVTVVDEVVLGAFVVSFLAIAFSQLKKSVFGQTVKPSIADDMLVSRFF